MLQGESRRPRGAGQERAAGRDDEVAARKRFRQRRLLDETGQPDLQAWKRHEIGDGLPPKSCPRRRRPAPRRPASSPKTVHRKSGNALQAASPGRGGGGTGCFGVQIGGDLAVALAENVVHGVGRGRLGDRGGSGPRPRSLSAPRCGRRPGARPGRSPGRSRRGAPRRTSGRPGRRRCDRRRSPGRGPRRTDAFRASTTGRPATGCRCWGSGKPAADGRPPPASIEASAIR